MSYRAGTYRMGSMGVPDCPPRLICDGCGVERAVTNAHGQPFAWLLNRKCAPRWGFDGSADMRRDWCQRCKATTGPR